MGKTVYSPGCAGGLWPLWMRGCRPVRLVAGCASCVQHRFGGPPHGAAKGAAKALPMGGDRRSDTLEAQAAEIPGWLEDEPDLFCARDRVAAGRCRRRDLGDGRRAPARAQWNHAQKRLWSRRRRQARKVDGWETLSQPIEPMPLDLAARETEPSNARSATPENFHSFRDTTRLDRPAHYLAAVSTLVLYAHQNGRSVRLNTFITLTDANPAKVLWRYRLGYHACGAPNERHAAATVARFHSTRMKTSVESCTGRSTHRSTPPPP